MFDFDKKNDPLAITRHGGFAGKANERGMSFQVDPNGIRTVISKDAAGNVTMLKTRAGFNEFTRNSTDESCIKGPFSEYDPVTAGYVVRSAYSDGLIWSIGNLVSVTIKRLRHVVVENIQRQRLLFSFIEDGEPVPSGLPTANVSFNEANRSLRTHYDPDHTILKKTYPYAWLVARFKTVVLPINGIVCADGKTLSFADPKSSGSNPTVEGCVRKALYEPNYPARSFVGGWLETLKMAVTSGAATLNFQPSSGFLSPLEDGADLACAEIKAIGTRVLGFRVGTQVTLNDNTVRPAKDHEYADSGLLYWLQPRDTELVQDEYGNVPGFLWRPATNQATRGPDVCIQTGTAPWPSIVPRVNSDDVVWMVSTAWTAPYNSITFYFNEMEGSGSYSTTIPVVWGTNQEALRSAGEPAPYITDVSKHGDKFLFTFAADNGYPAVVQGMIEFSITGDVPTPTISYTWICDPTTAISGAFYDENDTLNTLVVKMKTVSSWSRSVPASSPWPPSSNAFQQYTDEYSFGVAINGGPAAYAWGRTHHNRLDATPTATPGTWDTTTVDTHTGLAGTTSNTTNAYAQPLSPGTSSGGPTTTEGNSPYRLWIVGPKVFYAYLDSGQYYQSLIAGANGPVLSMSEAITICTVNPVDGSYKTYTIPTPAPFPPSLPAEANYI